MSSYEYKYIFKRRMLLAAIFALIVFPEVIAIYKWITKSDPVAIYYAVSTPIFVFFLYASRVFRIQAEHGFVLDRDGIAYIHFRQHKLPWSEVNSISLVRKRLHHRLIPFLVITASSGSRSGRKLLYKIGGGGMVMNKFFGLGNLSINLDPFEDRIPEIKARIRQLSGILVMDDRFRSDVVEQLDEELNPKPLFRSCEGCGRVSGTSIHQDTCEHCGYPLVELPDPRKRTIA